MTLHIYAQTIWHDEAYIAGTREALDDLVRAIGLALENNESSEHRQFASDGEGYRVHVVLATEEQAMAMPVPYTDDCAKANQSRIPFGPWGILRRKVVAEVGEQK